MFLTKGGRRLYIEFIMRKFCRRAAPRMFFTIAAKSALLTVLAVTAAAAGGCNAEYTPQLIIKNYTADITIKTIEWWKATDDLVKWRDERKRALAAGDTEAARTALREERKAKQAIVYYTPLQSHSKVIASGQRGLFDVETGVHLLVRVKDNTEFEDAYSGIARLEEGADTILILSEASAKEFLLVNEE